MSTHLFLCSLAFLDHWPLYLRKHNDSYINLFAYVYLIIYAFLEGLSPPEVLQWEQILKDQNTVMLITAPISLLLRGWM